MSTTFQQELLGTIANPTPKPGPILIPVKIHDLTGQQYIPVCEISSIFPRMVKLEVDGQIIVPTIGFSSLESAAKDTHKSLDAASSENVFLTDLCMNKEKAPQASDPPSEGNTSVDDRDPANSESDDETMDDNGSEAIRWIPYYPGKTIHAVHNIPSTSSSTAPGMQQFSADPLHFALTTPATSATSESFTATTPTSPPVPIPFELPEAYWIRFRKEIQKILHDHFQGALPQGQLHLEQEQSILQQEMENQQQGMVYQKSEQEAKGKEQEDQYLEQESQQSEHGNQQQNQESTTISLPLPQDENIVSQPAIPSHLSHPNLPKSLLRPISEVDNDLTLSRPTSPKDKPSALSMSISSRNKLSSCSRPDSSMSQSASASEEGNTSTNSSSTGTSTLSDSSSYSCALGFTGSSRFSDKPRSPGPPASSTSSGPSISLDSSGSQSSRKHSREPEPSPDRSEKVKQIRSTPYSSASRLSHVNGDSEDILDFGDDTTDSSPKSPPNTSWEIRAHSRASSAEVRSEGRNTCRSVSPKNDGSAEWQSPRSSRTSESSRSSRSPSPLRFQSHSPGPGKGGRYLNRSRSERRMMRSQPAPKRERYNEDNSDAEDDVNNGIKPEREEGEWTPGSQQSDLKFPGRRCSEQKTRRNHSLVREDRKRDRDDREDNPVDNRREDFYRSPLYNRNKKSRQESPPRHAAMGKRDKKSTNSWGQDSNRSGSREIEQPRFTRRDLVRFVKERNGSIHRTTCALTLTLDSRDVASKLYKLLQSRGYSGVWLSLTLKWMWDRQDMEELVEAIENSKIQTLVFNGTDPGGHRFGDSTTAQGHGNRSRCDPLVRLLGVKSLKELHLVGVPDILRASFANIPADLSHLSKLQIRHEIASNWENAHGARFYEAMKKATRLWTLVLDCPPSRTREYMEQIRNAIRSSSRANALANNARRRQPLPSQDEYMSQVLPAPSPPPYLDVHFNDQGKSFLTARFDRISGDILEYSLDLEQIERPQETRWTSFFLSEMALTLTALRLRHLRDDNWVLTILEWIKQHRKANRIQFKELTINCHQLSPERFLDFCSLVKESQSTLLALELTDFNPSLPQQTEHIYSENAIVRGWSSFFKSLDLLVLNTLYIQRSNFGDIAVQPLIDTLEDAKYQSHQLTLSKLLLFHTRVSDYGVELLRQAIDGTRCRLQV